jgi:phage repressor protein C with HTH and peptisase S24 domain
VETKDFRVSWLSRMGNPKKMVLMHVTGNSMEPYIHNADLTLICQDQTRIIPHKVYAVGIDEEIYIKELETLPGHRLVLRSYNKNYSPIEINMKGDLADSVRIIGRAVWWCHEA